MTKSRIAALAGAFLLSSGLASGALADATSEALVRAFIERIDKQAEWQATVADVSSQGGSTLVDGLKLGREDGSLAVTVPKLTLDSLALREGGGVNLASFASDTLEIKGASWTFLATGFSGKGLRTPSFEGWSFDPKMPVTSLARFYTRLAKTEFAEIALPSGSLDYEMQTPGTAEKTRSRTAYTNIRYDNLSNGILSSQSLERMETVSQYGAGAAITSVLEELKSNAANLSALARILDPDSYANGKGDGQWVTAVEGAGYGRVSVKQGDKETFSVASLSMGRLRVRQPAEPFAVAIDELIAKSGAPPEAEVFAFLEKHLSNLTGWFRFESIDMKGIAASPPEGGDVKLAGVGIRDVSSDGMKSFAIDDFTVNSPQLNAKLGFFEVADVVWPSLRSFILLGKLEETKKGGVPDAALVEEISTTLLDLFPRFGRMEIRDVSGGIPGSEPLTLKSYVSTSAGGMALLPREAKAKLDALVIPRGILRATPESAGFFDQLGYAELVAHVDGQASHDGQRGAYSSAVDFLVDDAGALRIAYGLGGLTPENIRAFIRPLLQAKDGNPDETAVMAAVGPLSLSNARVRYEDASLVKRLLPYLAKMQGTDEATLIGNATAMLQLGLSQLKNTAFTQQAVASVGAFLNNPRSLTLSLKPSQPVRFLQLMQIDPNRPGAAIDLLGVTMSAND
jgi:hypothetical protein